MGQPVCSTPLCGGQKGACSAGLGTCKCAVGPNAQPAIQGATSVHCWNRCADAPVQPTLLWAAPWSRGCRGCRPTQPACTWEGPRAGQQGRIRGDFHAVSQPGHSWLRHAGSKASYAPNSSLAWQSSSSRCCTHKQLFFSRAAPHPWLCRLARAPVASSSSVLPWPVTSSSGTCNVGAAAAAAAASPSSVHRATQAKGGCSKQAFGCRGGGRSTAEQPKSCWPPCPAPPASGASRLAATPAS